MPLTKIPVQKILDSNLPIPNEKKFEYQETTNSWFDIKKITADEQKNQQVIIKNTLLRCKQVRLYPTQSQKTKLLEIFEKYRRIYNFALKEFKCNLYLFKDEIRLYAILKKFQGSLSKDKKENLQIIADHYDDDMLDKFDDRDDTKIYVKLLWDIGRKNYDMKIKQIKLECKKLLKTMGNYLYFLNPKQFRDQIKYNLPDRLKIKDYVATYSQAIFDVAKSYKSATALKKARVIKHFRLRYKKINNPRACIVIESGNFSRDKNGFYIKTLGSMKTKVSLNNIKHDCRLTYDFNRKKFILNIPMDKEYKSQLYQDETCGVDPGIRAFQTIYSSNGCYQIGRNLSKLSSAVENITKAHDVINKIRQTKSFDSQIYKSDNKRFSLNSPASQHNQIILDKQTRSSLVRKLKKYLIRNRSKLQNKVKELHYKTANFICSKFKTIFVGDMSTKSIVKKNNVLNAKTKRMCYALSHYKFRYILINTAEKFNSQIKIVDESYTSKTCGGCGELNQIGGAEIYKCSQCNFQLNRDLNGARNILLKHN